MVRSPNYTEIDLSAMAHNLNQIKGAIGHGIRVMGLVKSDAYGHGLVPVSRYIEKEGVACLGVAHTHEALELRKQGVRIPIVILGGLRTKDEVEAVVDHDITPVLFNVSMADLLDRACEAKKGKKLSVYIKVDTGMGRLGIALDELGGVLRDIKKYQRLYVEGLISHLSSADDPSADFTDTQVQHFHKAIEICHDAGMNLPLKSLANSAGIAAHQKAHFNMVRAGIMIYGGLPSPDYNCPLSLIPVMHFKSKILQIRELPDQMPVSYGRTYHTQGQKRIAVLSAGYGDGVPIGLSNKGKVLIRGQKVNIVGRVCMNMTMTDVTDLKGVEIGDEAVFLGRQDDQLITGDDMAKWSGTISYDIFCSIGQRNRRSYTS